MMKAILTITKADVGHGSVWDVDDPNPVCGAFGLIAPQLERNLLEIDVIEDILR